MKKKKCVHLYPWAPRGGMYSIAYGAFAPSLEKINLTVITRFAIEQLN
jgi:hypothetical protein